MGGKTDPSPLFASLLGELSAGRAMGLPVSFYHGWPVRLPTNLVFVVFGLLAQTVALSLVGLLLFRCGLWSARVRSSARRPSSS